jgi:hypothetical protein
MPPDGTKRRRRLPAERQRQATNAKRYRDRVKACAGVAPVPYTEATIDKLVHLGALAEVDAARRDKIGTAIAAVLEKIVVIDDGGDRRRMPRWRP